MDYTISDIVYLKSGSPPLIVSDIVTTATKYIVTVVWIDEAKRSCQMTADGRCFTKEKVDNANSTRS